MTANSNKTITLWQAPGRRGAADMAKGFTEPFTIEPGDAEKLAQAVAFDTTLAEYSGGHRKGDKLKVANVVMGDVDNSHSDDPADWLQPADIAAAFPGVMLWQYPSRNNWKPKTDKTTGEVKEPRPKFHNLFAIEPTDDKGIFTGYMNALIERFPQLHFDIEVKGAAQLNFGVEGLTAADVTFTDGEQNLTDFFGGVIEPGAASASESKEDNKPPKSRNRKIPKGERNSTLNHNAGRLLKRYGDKPDTRRRFDEVCARCEPRLEKDEENTIYKSAQQFFHNVIEKSPSYKAPDLFDAPPFAIPTDKGYVIIPPLLADFYLERHTVIVVTDSGSPRLYEYENGAYIHRTDLEVKAALGAYITAFRRGLWSSGKVQEAYTAILHESRLYVEQRQLNADPDKVCLKNGFLNIKTWTLEPHDPAQYYTSQLDCELVEQIPETPVYDKTLYVYCEGSAAKQRFIMQYKGAVFSNVPGHKFKRFLLTIGERDSGKTIMKRLAEIIVGDGNFNNCDLADLENNRFAAASLHLKKLSGTNDLRAAKIPEVGRLLQLTGGDSMRVERKGEHDFSMIYTGYIWHVGNNKPIYGGKQNEALYLREILFELNHTIPQAEQDHRLLEKLIEEKQGIILKCLYAARTAIYDNDFRFHVPAECERSKSDHKHSNNMVSQFLTECAVPLELSGMKKSEADKHTAAKVWQAFKSWRDYVGEYKGITRNDFEGELATIHGVDAKDIKPMRRSGDIVGRFYPVMLNDEGIRYNGDIFL